MRVPRGTRVKIIDGWRVFLHPVGTITMSDLQPLHSPAAPSFANCIFLHALSWNAVCVEENPDPRTLPDPHFLSRDPLGYGAARCRLWVWGVGSFTFPRPLSSGHRVLGGEAKQRPNMRRAVKGGFDRRRVLSASAETGFVW